MVTLLSKKVASTRKTSIYTLNSASVTHFFMVCNTISHTILLTKYISMKKVSSFVLALVAALLVVTGTANAQTWNNSASPGNWQSANWGIPSFWPGSAAGNSAAIINPNAALTLNNSAPAFPIGNLDIQNAGGTFTVILNGTGTLTINGDLTVNNNLVIGQGFNVVLNGALRGSAQIIVATGATLRFNNTAATALQGTVVISNVASLGGGTSGTISFGPGFNAGVFPTSLFQGNSAFNTIEVNSALSVPGTFTMTSGPLILNGNLTVNPLGNLQLQQPNSNSLQGAGLLGAASGGQVTLGVIPAAAGTRNFNGGIIPGANFANPFLGQLNVTTGTLSGNLTFSGNGTLNINGGRTSQPLTVVAGSTLTINNTSPNAIITGTYAPNNNPGTIAVNAGATLRFGPGANASILPFQTVTNANGTIKTDGPMTVNLPGVADQQITPFPTTTFTSVLDLAGDLTLAGAGILNLTPLGSNTIIGTGKIQAANPTTSVRVSAGFNNATLNGNNFGCPFNGTFVVSTGANFDVQNTLCVGGPMILNALLTVTSNSEIRLSSTAPNSITGGRNRLLGGNILNATQGIVTLNNTGVVRLSSGFNNGVLPTIQEPFLISTGATAFKGRLIVESNQVLSRPLTFDIGSILDLNPGNLTVSSGTVLLLNNQGANSIVGTGFLQGTERNPSNTNTPGTVSLGLTFNNGVFNTSRFANPFLGMLNVSTASILTMSGNLVIGSPLAGFSTLFLGQTQLTIAQNSSLTLNGVTALSNTTASVATDATLPGLIQGLDCTSRLVLGPQFNNGVITAAGVIAQPFNGGLVIQGRGGLGQSMRIARAIDLAGVPVPALTIGQTGCLTLNDDVALSTGAIVVLNNQAAGSLSGTGRLTGPPLPQEARATLFGVPQITLGQGFNGGTINGPNFDAPLNATLSLPITPMNLNGTLTMGTTNATLLTQAPGTLTVLANSAITFTTNANAIWGGGRLAGTNLTSQFNLGNGNGFNTGWSGYGPTAPAAAPGGATGINATQFVQPFVGTMNIAQPPVNTNRPVYITSGSFTFAPTSVLNLFGPLVVTDATVPTPSSVTLNMTGANSLTGTTLGTVTGASVAVAINIGSGFNAGFIDGRRFGPTTPRAIPFVGSLRFPPTGTFRLSASLTTATVPIFGAAPGNGFAADNNAVAGEIQLNGSTLLIEDAIQLILSAEQGAAATATLGQPRITATAGGGLQGATNLAEVIVPLTVTFNGGAAGVPAAFPAITAATFISPFNGRLSLGTTNPLNQQLPLAPAVVAYSLPNVPVGATLTVGASGSANGVLNIGTSAVFVVQDGANLVLNNTSSTGASLPGGGNIRGAGPGSVITLGPGALGATIPGAVFSNPFIGSLVTSAGPEMTLTQPGITMGTGLADDARFTAGGPVAIGANANFTFNNTTAGRLLAAGAGSIRAADPTTSRFTFGANANGGDINGCIFANPWTGTMITNSAMAISENCRLVLGAPGSFDGVLNLGGVLTLNLGAVTPAAGGNLVINNRNPDFIVLPGLQAINPVGVATGGDVRNGRLTIGPSALSTTAGVAVIPNSRIGAAFSVNAGGLTGTLATSTGTATITSGTLVLSAAGGSLRIAGNTGNTAVPYSTSNQVLLGGSSTLTVLNTDVNAIAGNGVIQGSGVNSQVYFAAAANGATINGTNFGQHYTGQIYTNGAMNLTGNLRMSPAYSFATTTGASLRLGGTLTVQSGARLDLWNAGATAVPVLPAAGAIGGVNAGNVLVANTINPATVVLAPGFSGGNINQTGASPLLTPIFNGHLITSTGTTNLTAGPLTFGTLDAAGVNGTTGTLEIGGNLVVGAAPASLVLNNTAYRASNTISPALTGMLTHSVTPGATGTINATGAGSLITVANGFNGGYFPVSLFGTNVTFTPTCGAAVVSQLLGNGVGSGQLNILGPSALQMINGGFNGIATTSLVVNGTLQFGTIAGASAAGQFVIATGATLNATVAQNVDVANRGRISAIDPTGTFDTPGNVVFNTTFPILGAGTTGFTGRLRVNGNTNPGAVINGTAVTIAPSGTLDLCGPYLSLANVAGSTLNLNNTGAGSLAGTGIILGTNATTGALNFGAGFNAGILPGVRFGATTAPFNGAMRISSNLTVNSPLFLGTLSTFDFTSASTNKLILSSPASILGTLLNSGSTRYFVTAPSALTLGNVGSITFPVGPTDALFAPFAVTNNGSAAAFSVAALGAVTQVPALATGSTTVRQAIVNQQWNVTQVTGLTSGAVISLAPIWAAPSQHGAGFNSAIAVTNVYTTTSGTISSPAGAASNDAAFTGYLRSSVTLTQIATNNLNNTPVLVSSQPAPGTITFSPTVQSSGNTVVIVGARLVPGASVTLGGIAVPASGTTVISGGSSGVDTIRVVVPTNARSGDVVVTQPGGTSTATGFIFFGAPLQSPVIRLATPNPIAAGIGDVEVVITGAAFGTSNLRVVAVGSGITSTIVPSTLSTVTRITVTVPGAVVRVVGSLVLTVTSNDRLAVSTSVNVTAGQALVLTSLVPSTVTGNLAPQTISVNGNNFSAQSLFTLGASTLRIISVTRNADGTLTARLEAPAGIQTGSLTVTNLNGDRASLPFTVNNLPRPIITSVNPALLPPGSPNTIITIRGRNFIPGAVASFGGIQLSGLQLTGDSLITVTIPAGLLVREDLSVLTITNPDGQAIGYRLPITLGAPGAINLTSVSPVTTTATGNAFTATLTGTGFAGAVRVFLGGTQTLAVVSTSATEIRVLVPGNQLAGTYAVQVANPTGVVSNSLMLTISPAIDPTLLPAINSVSPGSGNQFPLNAAANITIIGDNFSANPIVRLTNNAGSTQLVVVSFNANQIVATIPASLLVGDYTLTVINTNGGVATQPYRVNRITNVSNEPLAGIRVYPNPVIESVSVEANLERAAKVVISVTNSLGQRVMVVEQQAAAGFYSRSLNINSLPTGAYMVEITDGTRRSVEKIIKN